MQNVQIYISGSSAKMLSREIASSMRGRALELIIYPYSYREFLKSRNIDIPPSLKHVDKQMRSMLEHQLLTSYHGWFPRSPGARIGDRYFLLQSYVNTVLFRDIVERFNVTNTSVLKNLIRHLKKPRIAFYR